MIGDGLYVSTGAKLTTVEHLGNNVIVAANTVVTKSWNEDNILLVGMPAVIKKNTKEWYSDNEYYAKCVRNVEDLKEIVYG